jgi:hypothetical protein
MELSNGTYLRLGNDNLVKIDTNQGYWVAYEQVELADTLSGELVGVWTDTDTGKVWVDRVQFFDKLEPALFIAEQFNQLAIWDNANQKEIRL